jgi:segregation and condensation protein B
MGGPPSEHESGWRKKRCFVIMRIMHPLRKPLALHGRRLTTDRLGNAPLPPVYKQPTPLKPTTPEELVPGSRSPKVATVEALFFMADEPLTLKKITDAALLTDIEEAKEHIQTLKQLYDLESCAFQIEELAGGYQILTRPQYHSWLLRWRRSGQDLRLTPTMMETLALIAYRQPITRADVEKIRGTTVTEPIRFLMERGLVRTAGREKSLGRPQLYATTRKFLQFFGLKDITSLPQVESLRNPGV